MPSDKEKLKVLLDEIPLNTAQRELVNSGLDNLSPEEIGAALASLTKAKASLGRMEEIRKSLLEDAK